MSHSGVSQLKRQLLQVVQGKNNGRQLDRDHLLRPGERTHSRA